MVNIISNTWGNIQLIIIIGIMALLLGLIIYLDYFKKVNEEDKKILYILISLLFTMQGFLLVLTVIDLILIGSTVEIVLEGIVLTYLTILIVMILLRAQNKQYNRNIFLVILAVLLISIIVVIIIIWAQGSAYNSIHIGSILGIPALILLSLGTILVILSEKKYVLYHGYTAGSAWIFTFINVILLFTLSAELFTAYSGWIHAFHIVCGGVGLTFGFTSALFGISGQRKLAKVTGYTTLGCWWLAYLLSIFIGLRNIM